MPRHDDLRELNHDDIISVASECLEFALATNQEAGVWGGLTEEERRRLRKGIDVPASATAPQLA